MLQELKDEMYQWYSGKGGYDAKIVSIVVEQITDTVFVCIGGMYGMVEEINIYKNEDKAKQG